MATSQLYKGSGHQLAGQQSGRFADNAVLSASWFAISGASRCQMFLRLPTGKESSEGITLSAARHARLQQSALAEGVIADVSCDLSAGFRHTRVISMGQRRVGPDNTGHEQPPYLIQSMVTVSQWRDGAPASLIRLARRDDTDQQMSSFSELADPF
jgi:hypothetical protein